MFSCDGPIPNCAWTGCGFAGGATARDRLRHAEAKYRTVVEQLPLVTYIDALTATASGIYASPQIELLLGYTPDEWINDPEIFAKLLHPDDRERVLALVDHCNHTGCTLQRRLPLDPRRRGVVRVQDENLIVHDEEGRRSSRRATSWT